MIHAILGIRVRQGVWTGTDSQGRLDLIPNLENKG